MSCAPGMSKPVPHHGHGATGPMPGAFQWSLWASLPSRQLPGAQPSEVQPFMVGVLEDPGQTPAPGWHSGPTPQRPSLHSSSSNLLFWG